ncbi:hypothetical protein EPI10_021700 [Gossypium australe]|uniref:Uncharacterized protein n=1 Tax=Gossypium australe TaxID=47621 RepID=A0A5B6WJA9_9ROSI|nr:hypothetical protein EPI10_021700 [Gossypium australe]
MKKSVDFLASRLPCSFKDKTEQPRIKHLNIPNPAELSFHQECKAKLKSRSFMRLNAANTIYHHLQLRLRSQNPVKVIQDFRSLHLIQESQEKLRVFNFLHTCLYLMHKFRLSLRVDLKIGWNPRLLFLLLSFCNCYFSGIPSMSTFTG